MGEYFMYQGKDVLIIYDDLSPSMRWPTVLISLSDPPSART